MTSFCGLFLLLSAVGLEATSYVTLNTSFGPVSGAQDEIVTFFGVPYASVNESDPYGPAIPQPPFETLFEAHDGTVMCPQMTEGALLGTTQCLTMNIYTPLGVKAGRKQAVMVYIFGGRFQGGDAITWNPRWLVKQDLIVVIINSRLGPFGYLCLPGTQYVNQGLKDQEMALKWVKDNIENFGGDSERITLFGHSSGAVSVDFQVLYNNVDQRLFKRAIIQSGHAVNPVTITLPTPPEILTKLKFKTQSRLEKSVFRIIEETHKYHFGPCVDGEYITATPKVTYFNDMEIIVGSVDLETFYDIGKNRKTFFDNYSIASTLKTGFWNIADIDDVVTRIKMEYGIKNGNAHEIIEFDSDYTFIYPMLRSIRYYLDKGATVRRYWFSYMGKRNYMRNHRRLDVNVTTHADELGYLFDLETLRPEGEDLAVVKQMVSMWVTFAKSGYSNNAQKDKLLLPRWDPTETANGDYLHIRNASLTKMSWNQFKHLELWDEIYEQNAESFKSIDLRISTFDYILLSVCISTSLMIIALIAVAFRCYKRRQRKY